MRAMILERTVSLSESSTPLTFVDNLPIPKISDHEILIRVSACGVCHTELDEIEGRTAPPDLPVIPGHEVVGVVDLIGKNVSQHAVGDRVGVGWIHCSCGSVDENLSPEFQATGRDVNGGYAEFMKVPESYAYPIPDVFSDVEAAPLLCAGAIGFRSLRLTNLQDGEPLGLTGFGGSAHLVIQIAKKQFPTSSVYVFSRGDSGREHAKALGAAWVGDTTDRAPEPLQAIIDTTPAWKPVVEAMANLKPGGRLVINAIRKEDEDQDELLRLSYHDHLWMEKEIKSVANITQHDIRDFLPVAASIPLKPNVKTYPLEDANKALMDLKAGHLQGVAVLQIH